MERLLGIIDKKIIETNEKEAPVSFQIEGHKPELMAKAAKMLEPKATFIDINMGCPVKKVLNAFFTCFRVSCIESSADSCKNST